RSRQGWRATRRRRTGACPLAAGGHPAAPGGLVDAVIQGDCCQRALGLRQPNRPAEGVADALLGRLLERDFERSEARLLRTSSPPGGPERLCPTATTAAPRDGEKPHPLQDDQGHGLSR